MVDINSQAPDFSLFDTARQRVTLSDHRGKKVVLAFFPAAFTGVCEAELCSFRDSLAELNDANATVLAISVDLLPGGATPGPAAASQRRGHPRLRRDARG